MKRILFFIFIFIIFPRTGSCWGFYAHRQINTLAVFLLPPEMLLLFKPNINFLAEHATDPDKRRYAVAQEGMKHYIDIDHYGVYPFTRLPHKWDDAVKKFSEDSLNAYGIVPWQIQRTLSALTTAFKEKNFGKIMKLSAELGHYVADAHVPLHTNSNHNGQFTNQVGIHGFWESRVPELLAEKEFDFFIGKAEYIINPGDFVWKRVMESAIAADSVLLFEKLLSKKFTDDKKFAFEEKEGKLIRQYSSSFTVAYNNILDGMVERRMRQSILSVASLWYTAWVNAGQPSLQELSGKKLSAEETKEFDMLQQNWNKRGKMIGRQE
jgi:hypothetical protein